MSKLAGKRLLDYALVIATVGAMCAALVTTVSFNNYVEKTKVEQSQKDFELFMLRDSLANQNEHLDSLENTIRKILSIKQNPIKPAFEMNSLFGRVYQAIKASGAKCPEAMLALASHETGRFTSRLSQHHNHFGLAYDSKNPLVSGKVWSEGDGHFKSVFASDEDCFRYMADWQKRKKALSFNSNEDFIKSLKRVNYAASPYHGQIVMQCYNDLFDQRNIKAEIEAEAFKNKFLFAYL